MNKGLTPKSINVLTRAMEHINTVPYKVTLRWVFYRLYQDGLYTTKDDYEYFKKLTAKARHGVLCGWTPETVQDDTRHMYLHGIGDFTESDAIDNIKCNIDKLQEQEIIPLILFEANAMYRQFEYYTEYIPLFPFGGEPSIPYKYDIAKTIEYIHKTYRVPVTLLYFGDYDTKGKQIFNTAMKHIIKWCNVPFTIEHCGLSPEHVKKYDLPLSIKGRGYQWEALTDKQASEIILSSVSNYQDLKTINPYVEQEKQILDKWKTILLESIGGGHENKR